MNTDERAKRITRTSFIGIGANLLLATFKAAVGAAAGSVSVVLDAVNNLTDALSSVITILGVKLSQRPPNAKHPFGYGRVEYFSAITIASLVLAAGAGALVESVRKIAHPVTPEYGAASIAVISVAVVAKFALGRYVSSQGRKYNSDALVASGADAVFDALISAATLAGAIVLLVFGVNVDGWIGAAISVFVLKSGIEMLLASVSNILGRRPDAEVTGPIRDTILSVDGVLGIHDLILHNYGPDFAIGSVHIEVSSELSAEEIYRITRMAQIKVMERHHLILTIGIYAIDPGRREEREKIETVVLGHNGVRAVHGIFFDEALNVLMFDVVIDFSVRDRSALHDAISSDLTSLFPGRKFMIYLESDYAD